MSERAEGTEAGGGVGGAGEAARAPKTAGGWPIVVVVGLALLLPVAVFLVPMGGGRTQFEQLFSDRSSERAQALDYWSTTFRGSEPRLYDSTIVAERLDDRMRAADAEVVLDFHRHFLQDPGYVVEFRPTYLRGVAVTLERTDDPEGRARAMAQLLMLLRQERSGLEAGGPTLNAEDHVRLERAFVLYAEGMRAHPAEEEAARAAEARTVLAAAMLVSPALVRRVGEAIGEGELAEDAAADAPDALPVAG